MLTRAAFFIPLIAIMIFGSAGTATATDAALNPVDIKEWLVPDGGRPRDPYAIGADDVWFVGQSGDYLAHLKPSTGVIEKIPLDDHPGPHNLIVGTDGVVWYAGNQSAYIGRYDPVSGKIERIEMPDPAVRDPHTLVFDAGEKHIWFTAQWPDAIGRMSVADRKVDIVFTATKNSRPYGIKVGPDGAVWSVLVGTNKLARVDPKTLTIEAFDIPDNRTRPRRLEITGDGRIWYADYARGQIGLYDPGKKAFREWPLPAGNGARPYGMASDKDGRVWVVETGVSPNRLIGFDTAAEKIISVTPIPSGAGSIRHMHYFEPENAVWFGTDASTIGRFSTDIR